MEKKWSIFMPTSEPIVRWAGGKTWFVPHLPEIINNIQFEHYHEPFLGGGAVFFALEHHKKAYLSDANGQLINTYIQIRDNDGPLYHDKTVDKCIRRSPFWDCV